jgi:hypothetical protein
VLEQLDEIYICETRRTSPHTVDSDLQRQGLAKLRRTPRSEDQWKNIYTSEACGYVHVILMGGRWAYIVDLTNNDVGTKEAVLSIIRESGFRVVSKIFKRWDGDTLEKEC